MIEKSKYFRVGKTYSQVDILSSQLAFISAYCISNPFHAFLEDGNFYEFLNHENEWNEKNKEENGTVIYELAKNFIEEYNELSLNEKHEVFKKANKKWKYYNNKIRDKLHLLSGIPKGEGLCYNHYLENEQIFFKVKNENTKEFHIFSVF